jgi:type VI secretion system protein ImpG
MQELLPYYERELGFLRGASRDFAERYPKIAAGLGMTGEVCEDPHVERMIESFALLTARISKKLDDDYPEFTDALLDVLYPHYLRPFPACSIAQFAVDSEKLTSPVVLKRGTLLNSHPVRGVACRFRMIYDVKAVPLKIARVEYVSSPLAPGMASVQSSVTGRLSITLSMLQMALAPSWQDMGPLRCYLHGEASLVAALRDGLFLKSIQAFADVGDRRWHALSRVPVDPCGFELDEALIDFPASSHPAYRLLAEYFAFPEKFNFFDLDIEPLMPYLRKSGQCTLHIMVQDIAADSNLGKMLETATQGNVRLGCTPVVNLFTRKADPIRVTHKEVAYPVVADGRRAYAYEVYAIDRVRQVRQSAQGDEVVEFKPFYSLHHGDRPEREGNYWISRRDEMIAERSPGYETEISLVDVDFNPAAAQIETLSLDLTCTNRDLPSLLKIGQSGGDLFLEGGSFASQIRMLRRPTATLRFQQGRGLHWRLISHLSLNHLSLVKGGLPAIKETLKLYDLASSPVTARQIDGLLDLDYKPATIWMAGEPFASFVRGIEIQLTIDPDNFVGTSLHAFVAVLNRFFALYVHANSFVQLVVLARDSKHELIRCEPCNGDSILV